MPCQSFTETYILIELQADTRPGGEYGDSDKFSGISRAYERYERLYITKEFINKYKLSDKVTDKL